MAERLTRRPTDRKGRELWRKQQAADRAARKATKGKARKAVARKARAKPAPKAPRARKPAGGEAEAPKAYRLIGGIPDLPREGTTGRAILVSIKDRGLATAAEIAKDVDSEASPLTIQKYLRIFVDGEIIRVAEDRA
ncbi:MAG: hypothetical protein V4597_08385 [Pseudomonadota bacterium]